MWNYSFERAKGSEFPTIKGQMILKVSTTEDNNAYVTFQEALKAASEDPKFEPILFVKRRIGVLVDSTLTESMVVDFANALNILDTKSRKARLDALTGQVDVDPTLQSQIYVLRPYVTITLKATKEGLLPSVPGGNFPQLWSTITLDVSDVEPTKLGLRVGTLASTIASDQVKFAALIAPKDATVKSLVELGKKDAAWEVVAEFAEKHAGLTFVNNPDTAEDMFVVA